MHGRFHAAATAAVDDVHLSVACDQRVVDERFHQLDCLGRRLAMQIEGRRTQAVASHLGRRGHSAWCPRPGAMVIDALQVAGGSNDNAMFDDDGIPVLPARLEDGPRAKTREVNPVAGRKAHCSDCRITRMFTNVVIVCGLLLASQTASAQTAAPTPTDRTKAHVYSAADLAAAIAKLPTDRPAASVRVFTLTPYNVAVERRLPREQGASMHEAQAELFYVIDGAATLLTGGKLIDETRNGTNLSGKGIEGGMRQTFGKGDFLLVPSGIPHQFVDIKAPIQLMSIYLPNAQ